MKINEVEALAGIAKKNIRFYEEQGLISPRRNPENGYRDYGEEDVLVLRRIRLLRHLISLERQQRNLQQAMELCQELAYQDIPISQLDTESLLTRMETLEQAGTSFHDVAAQDIRTRYIAPVVVTAVVVTFMTALSGLLLWALTISPEDAPPIWFVLVVIGFFAAVGVGCVAALTQRIREIQKGEIDDAKKY